MDATAANARTDYRDIVRLDNVSAKYKRPGLALNTGAGVVTPQSINALVPLIDSGIR